MSKLDIKLYNWEHECGDGCCYSWGTNIWINGKRLDSVGDFNQMELLKTVLTHLGYEVEITESTEESEAED